MRLISASELIGILIKCSECITGSNKEVLLLLGNPHEIKWDIISSEVTWISYLLSKVMSPNLEKWDAVQW